MKLKFTAIIIFASLAISSCGTTQEGSTGSVSTDTTSTMGTSGTMDTTTRTTGTIDTTQTGAGTRMDSTKAPK
ncbi:MAG: hypothetical protein H7141_01340 [Burkholderiales bacterium]|nr:hypothetical protein [Bacteroidia bacterium]